MLKEKEKEIEIFQHLFCNAYINVYTFAVKDLKADSGLNLQPDKTRAGDLGVGKRIIH